MLGEGFYMLNSFALLVLVILCFAFFMKERLHQLEDESYARILIVSLIAIVFGISSGLCLYLPEPYGTFALEIISKIYLALLVWDLWVFAFYTLCISKKFEKFRNLLYKYGKYMVILLLIVILLLPEKIVINGDYFLPNGPSVMFTFSLFGIIYTFLIILIILDLKNIRSKKYVPIVMLIIQGILLVIIQMIKPELNYIINPSTVLTCLIMYFTIENPDMKMLAEVSAARDQADKANRAKSDFLSSMSHEIRTPLNAIVGLSEDIASYIDQVPPEVVEDTKDIQNASQTLLEIVGNILDISKIESNKMEIVNGPYNLKEEIEGLCKVTSTRIGDKPIDYTLTIADDVPYELIGDKGKVKEIVNNLFTNSIKYTEKGQINLSIRCVNDFANMYSTIYITCQDTGRGIKAESISRLFEKFDRLDVERNTTTEGTGLGLAITKKVIEMMGGKINVSSQFGVGSIFMVAIPQKISKIARPEGENELSETSQLANSNFDLGKRRVLIVDDNNLNIKVAIKALKDFNFDLDSCHSGQECLDKVAAGEHYDLILMDIMMPGMSGDTTLHKLQETGNFSIPVIALTADAIAGAKEKYISAGFVDYIAKPFSRDQIKGKLEKIFIKGNNQ